MNMDKITNVTFKWSYFPQIKKYVENIDNYSYVVCYMLIFFRIKIYKKRSYTSIAEGSRIQYNLIKANN